MYILCRHHHRLRHHHGHTIQPTTPGAYQWHAPNGKTYLVHPDRNLLLTTTNLPTQAQQPPPPEPEPDHYLTAEDYIDAYHHPG
jgi:hypothetical protein